MAEEIYQMKFITEDNIGNLRILGKEFVKNNLNKAKLIISNKKSRLKSLISIYNLKNNKIKMILSKDIINKNGMFKNCLYLESLSEYSIDKEKEEFQNENEYNEEILESEDNSLINSNNFNEGCLIYKNYETNNNPFFEFSKI